MKYYYAVIFTSKLVPKIEGYVEVAETMGNLAKQQQSYLGRESVPDKQYGITVPYWENEAAIKNWRNQIDHSIVRKMGKEQWYESYRVRVCRVERDCDFGELS